NSSVMACGANSAEGKQRSHPSLPMRMTGRSIQKVVPLLMPEVTAMEAGIRLVLAKPKFVPEDVQFLEVVLILLFQELQNGRKHDGGHHDQQTCDHDEHSRENNFHLRMGGRFFCPLRTLEPHLICLPAQDRAEWRPELFTFVNGKDKLSQVFVLQTFL